MNAWALRQVEHLSLIEIAGAVVAGLLLLWLILALFRPRRAPPPGQSASTPQAFEGALGPVINTAEQAIIALARRKVASAGAFHFGAVDISPDHLAFWITTATDAERDRLAADTAMQDHFRRVLLRAGYPVDAVPKVAFAFESQETVERVHGGNWWYAVK